MPDIEVTIEDRPDVEIVRINESEPTFRIAVDRAEDRLLEMADDLLLDVLDVAGAVFAVDSSVRRGGAKRKDFGTAWRRDLAFDIPVRCHAVWQQDAVRNALTEMVNFVTEDNISFTFRDRGHDHRWGRQQMLFSREGDDVDTVVLFSGGLDSLAGALEMLRSTAGRIALVTHRSAPKIRARQDRLAAELDKRFPGRVVYVPIEANRVEEDAVEFTQRSRSVLFLALGYLVARLLKARRIIFFENGVVSTNLPISSQVVGSMATRTTHPWALELMRRFLGALGGEPIAIDSPYAWLTKTEVLQRLASFGGTDLIRESVSCSHVRDRPLLTPHCGGCSQCLDRRFAILAAGLEASDPEEAYETRLLVDSLHDDRTCTLALDWTRKAVDLAAMDHLRFAEVYAGELQRVIPGHPDLTAGDVVRRCFEMQQRHGEQVRRVLVLATGEFAARIAAGDLPPKSLLAMFINRQTGLPAEASIAIELPNVDVHEQDTDEGFEIFPLRASFFSSTRGHAVDIRNLATIHGSNAEMAHSLLPAYREDRAAGRSTEEHRYFPAKEVRLRRLVAEVTIRQRVNRCRDELNAAYFAIMGESTSRQLLIETGNSGGYRLDPTMIELPYDPMNAKM